ncbi:AUGMIN subunit [Trifolium repens]|nr:AUGMIN subunit [Trifolium repens]
MADSIFLLMNFATLKCRRWYIFGILRLQPIFVWISSCLKELSQWFAKQLDTDTTPILVLPISHMAFKRRVHFDLLPRRGNLSALTIKLFLNLNLDDLEFINHLINLLARHQLLKIACQLKRSTCSELIICLSLLSLSCNHTCLQQRVEWFSMLIR